MKLLRKFIKKAIAQDALPVRAEYPINFYRPKKDSSFLSYISRKNPFAYYLLQTNMPNEVLTEDPLGVRIGRLFSGSKTRKIDPRTGSLSNNDYGSGKFKNNFANHPTAQTLNLMNIRTAMNMSRNLQNETK